MMTWNSLENTVSERKSGKDIPEKSMIWAKSVILVCTSNYYRTHNQMVITLITWRNNFISKLSYSVLPQSQPITCFSIAYFKKC